ncbi:MAG: hypothetical protein E6R04_02450 [Spirochaetes bacterium]|nr:MAG: hypothetical protein E6R04_02450 [Spirochaetota bacterium]
MKLNRSELKSIIKECLLELAQEGKLSFASNELNEIKNPVGAQTSSGGITNSRLQSAIEATTRAVSGGNAGKKAMFESIIADTARTTLQKQLAAAHTGAGTLVEAAVSPEERHFDQTQLGQFEAKDRWALLAFAGKPKSS